MPDKYVNIFTDFGFKKLFGTELNKDLVIDFLNSLINEQGTITDITYLQNEQLGQISSDRPKLTKLEYDSYETSLKYYRDLNNVIQTAAGEAYQEGREEGREAGLYDAYLRLIASRMTEADAKRLLGL